MSGLLQEKYQTGVGSNSSGLYDGYYKDELEWFDTSGVLDTSSTVSEIQFDEVPDGTSYRWLGTISPIQAPNNEDEDNTYCKLKFTLTSDDSSLLFIYPCGTDTSNLDINNIYEEPLTATEPDFSSGYLVCDNKGHHSSEIVTSNFITLNIGTNYNIMITYGNRTGGSIMKLEYSERNLGHKRAFIDLIYQNI